MVVVVVGCTIGYDKVGWLCRTKKDVVGWGRMDEQSGIGRGRIEPRRVQRTKNL